MKIVFISQTPLSEQIIQKWCINDLDKNGISWEYLDVGAIIRSDYFRGAKKFQNEIIVDSIDKLIGLISLNKYDICITLINLNFNSYRLYKLIKKFCMYSIYFDWGHMPYPYESIAKRISSKKLNYLIKQVVFLIKKKVCLKFKYNLIFQAGSVSKLCRDALKVKQISYADIEYFIDAGTSFKNEYIVFLDSNICGHPDTLTGEYKIDKKLYLDSLNHFFLMIEKKMRMRVIIAAHPTSNFTAHDFKDREVIYNKTAILVRESYMVISHQSTSISYPILYKKRILFLGMRVMENLKIDNPIKVMECMSRILGVEFIYTDDLSRLEKLELKNISAVDNARYDYFISKYISTLGPKYPRNKDIIIPELLKVLMEKKSEAINLHTNL